TANRNSANVSILLGNGDGTFATAVNYAAGTESNSVVVGDWNRDGKLDLAVADHGSNTVSVLLGKGDGTFNAATSLAVAGGPYAIASADVDGDGRADLVTANE